MSISTSRSTRTLHRTAGVLALSLVAAGVTAVGTTLLGVAPPLAEADPGDTYVPTGSSQLVQSEDLAAIVIPLDTERVLLGRDRDFSSCLGEGNRWTEVLPDSPKPVSSAWTRTKHRDETLTEEIAQAPDEATARRWEAILVQDGIAACRTSQLDFHVGRLHRDNVGSGTATWAVSYRGQDQHPDGGVAVVRSGVNVGFVEVNGRWGSVWQTMESVAKVATNRLG